MKTILTMLIVLLMPLSASAQADCSAGVPVTMQLSSDLSATVPSAAIGIYAELHNSGTEILQNARLAVDVISADGAIVDRFVTPDPVTIFAENSAKVGFIWRVPGMLEDGTYTVRATLAPHGALRAAVFAHTLYPSATLPITVHGGSESSVQIGALAVNARAYEHGTVAPFSQGRLAVSARADNGSGIPFKGSVRWNTYAPDATLDALPIDTRSTSAEIHVGGESTLTYDLPRGSGAYYVEGYLSDAHSNQYVDFLLDQGGSAFPWAHCAISATARSMVNVTLWATLGAIVVIAAGVALFFERRRL